MRPRAEAEAELALLTTILSAVEDLPLGSRQASMSTRIAGPWRVVKVELTARARPAGITRDGDKEATRDGEQWRISYNGTFMGYALTEDEVAGMLGDDYGNLEEA